MAKIKPPQVPDEPVAIPTDAEIRALLATCEGRDKRIFRGRRDAAILRLFLDTGMRRSELAGLTQADLDRERREVTVLGKGRRHRTLSLRAKTVPALNRYLHARQRHHDQQRPELWLGMGGSGQAVTNAKAGNVPGPFAHADSRRSGLPRLGVRLC